MDREWLDADNMARIRYDLKFLGRLKHINGWLVLKINECSSSALDIGEPSCYERNKYILNGLISLVMLEVRPSGGRPPVAQPPVT